MAGGSATTFFRSRHSLRVLMRRAADAGHILRLDHILGIAASGSSPQVPASTAHTILKAINHREVKIVFDGVHTLTISDGDGNQSTPITVNP